MNLKKSEKTFNFIKENKTKNCFFIVARNRYLNDLCNIFGSIVLNKDYKFNPIVVEQIIQRFSDLNNSIYENKHEDVFQYFEKDYILNYLLVALAGN